MTEATKRLGDYPDLNLSFVYEKSDQEDGTVLAMDPIAGTEVAPDSKLTLTVSQADQKVMDVSGMTQEAAQEALLGQGYKVEVSKENSDTVKKGLVIRTEPAADTVAQAGDTVTIVVSDGTAKEYVTMTDLSNMSENGAIAEIERLGLNKGTISYKNSDTVTKGKVMAQTEAEGTQLEKGSRVGFTVSLGKAVKETPTPAPKPTEYIYQGTVTISENPFEYADEEPAQIDIVLTQDGVQTQVYSEVLSYDDFPKKITVQGSSEGTGTITVYKDKNIVSGASYTITFKKVAK